MSPSMYSIEQFIHDTRELLASGPDQARLFERGSAYLERLLANPAAVPEKYRRPFGDGRNSNHGSYLVHREPGLSISAVVWGPGDHIGPHDHHTWGMIGVMDNAIQEVRFRRVDDRTREGYATLEKIRSLLVKPGGVSLLVPDLDEIHQIDNFSDRPTTEIHVYGRDLVGVERCSYDLETGRITPFVKASYDNC